MISRSNQAGVSMIEILVSIVIICFGLLGVAGLLTTGIKNTQVSQLRTQASFLAYDMADRMRSNRQAALDGQYRSAVTATNTVALNDATQWQAAVASLPSGAGTVVMGNTRFFTITVQWDDSNLAGGDEHQQFVVVGEL